MFRQNRITFVQLNHRTMQSRRDFLKTAATVPMVGSTVLENILPNLQAAPGFRLLFMATNWGFQGDMAAFCAKAKQDGYDGIEVWTPSTEDAGVELVQTVRRHGLQLGVLCGSWQSDFDTHLAEFNASLKRAITLEPLYINCHAGRDWYSIEQNVQLLRSTALANQTSGVPIYHETHRGRMLFSVPQTMQFLKLAPELRLTLDISHWCTVHESMLEDQMETVQQALQRTDHIHARVGHPEGPQVNDPRAPEWASILQQHLDWWDVIVQNKAKAGAVMTICPEFGPPHYMQALPYTLQPVADLWAVNKHMKDLLQQRYSTR